MLNADIMSTLCNLGETERCSSWNRGSRQMIMLILLSDLTSDSTFINDLDQKYYNNPYEPAQ